MGIDFFAIFATPRRRSKKLERPADEEECEKWRPPMDPVRRRQHHHHLAEESLLFFLFFFYRVLPSFTDWRSSRFAEWPPSWAGSFCAFFLQRCLGFIRSQLLWPSGRPLALIFTLGCRTNNFLIGRRPMRNQSVTR